MVAGLVGCAVASAQNASDWHTAQPERPTVATHAGTVAPRVLEIETGVELDHVADAEHTVLTPTVLKYGLAPAMQLNVFGSVDRASGEPTTPGDLAVGVKWRVANDAPVVGDFAVLPAVKFPTGSQPKGTGTGTTDASLLLISSHDLGPVAMDLNVGYTRRGGDGSQTPRNATLWTASFGGPLARTLGWVGELYGYPTTHGPEGQANIVAVLAGPTLEVRKWLVFDTGAIIPVTGPQPYAWYAGMVYNVGRW
jgi:hypothetical protein